MDLVDEYLRAVGALLPKAQREDITAELRDTILTRIEDREAELGHALTEAETEAVLHEVGHPILVAARYREGPQQVIGPALYPYWAFAVKVAVTIQAAIGAIGLVVRLLGGRDFGQALGQALGAGLSGTMLLIGMITLAGWLIERRWVEIGDLKTWRVRDLRMLEFASWDWGDLGRGLEMGRVRMAQAPRKRRRSVDRGLGCIIGGAIIMLWWIGLFPIVVIGDPHDLQVLGLNLGALEGVDWAAFKAMLFLPVLAYCAALILLGVVLLVRPQGLGLIGLLDTTMGAGLLAFAAWLWTWSPIASAIRVDSVTGFAMRMREFGAGWPTPIPPIVTLVVMGCAVGGLTRLVRGVWEMASAVGPAERSAEA